LEGGVGLGLGVDIVVGVEVGNGRPDRAKGWRDGSGAESDEEDQGRAPTLLPFSPKADPSGFRDPSNPYADLGSFGRVESGFWVNFSYHVHYSRFRDVRV
jgi:hypothetical protein